ncbi:16S rRNA (cytidine(1402)-2'-O)-methyltransferase [Fictibacillus gelatini]|uniref:16S rRNA (cytidine(1402)-2'-O)-methyltransferase n=1 Tax=Fictibacillus gelatini TaxID=225985 RepID=UPI0004058788|nr:16S rRNA (cytidine(1402)-2'-O)-methyltransferase [Fictibacillus gelatini]
MWQQKSYESDHPSGVLYLVPTPIGNLEDMTFRAVRTLKEVDKIAAEDTRQTKKLLNHFDIHTPLVSYHDHNKTTSGNKIIQALNEGKNIALVSDAGMPAISDPGYELVVQCVAEKIPVVPLPGANAALPALVASGLPNDSFYFYGFLPRGKKEKKEQLTHLANLPFTLIFYEAPHRLKETLQFMHDHLGDRHVCIARELTKKYEEIIRGTLSEALSWCKDSEVRGEFCLIVEGNKDAASWQEEEWWRHLSIVEHVEHYMKEKGLTSKEAIKQVANDRQLPKREVYNTFHIEEK